MYYLLLFHSNNGYVNVSQYYLIHTLHVLLIMPWKYIEQSSPYFCCAWCNPGHRWLDLLRAMHILFQTLFHVVTSFIATGTHTRVTALWIISFFEFHLNWTINVEGMERKQVHALKWRVASTMLTFTKITNHSICFCRNLSISRNSRNIQYIFVEICA